MLIVSWLEHISEWEGHLTNLPVKLTARKFGRNHYRLGREGGRTTETYLMILFMKKTDFKSKI